MQVVILCGGKGMRMNGLSKSMPKTLATIQNKPIIWHIMSLYSKYAHTDFILPLGYQGDKIKEYLFEYHWKYKNCKFNFPSKQLDILEEIENWNVTCVETGADTMTGARIKKIEPYIQGDTFMITYGDGLADINIDNLIKFHKETGKTMTLTGIVPTNQYGVLKSSNNIITEFQEKPVMTDRINGGFFVCDKNIFQYLDENEDCVLEEGPFQRLIEDRELAVYNHDGKWISIDTYKDLITANTLWHA
ncbi:glucose-1-phosphate cytidylyltransferase [Bacillus thuringiensis]|uniref:sugar phosphate nucleotidyltransferase n=1 Tax=Bacillus thuringiensis TaxID=1428 RepID=UPI0010ABDD63|nr:sugar phosphate nucleotidyltransferase [Bacillus thuringiensis]TKA00361.1 glucose-1-phosphate cytidylyltransferase [Bacillus thuringiensis]